MADSTQHNDADPSRPLAPASIRPRPLLARLFRWIGFEGKVVLAVVALVSAALASTCWLWASHIDSQITHMLGEQARQTAATLSMASRPGFAARDVQSLQSMGEELIDAKNILFVAFYNVSGNNIAFTDRNNGTDPAVAAIQSIDVSSLTQVRTGNSQTLGDYLEVCQPVLSAAHGSANSRLMGYVAVGISPTEERLQAQRVNFFAIGIGCVAIIWVVPIAYLLVHRIFLPIRELVEATNRISAGELDADVAIDRPDAIGELARSFNAMVKTIKAHQQSLRQANSDLELKVTQRTSQLESANRRLSSEIAEKEDFLRAVSHDLNAPLRNISGMASMLLTKHAARFDEEVVHRLQRIQKNVEAETTLISELLELSRIKTRREKMEMVDIFALVNDLEGLLENDLKTRNISLIVDTPLPVLNGERSRFRQIFQNLIDNAIKYMGDGELKEIHIGCEVRDSEAQFYVRDTGLGIDEADIAKVFHIFRRGKNSATRNIPGKGVGLSCVKSIIETYNGTIWVQSQPGAGSTFLFTINGQYVPDSARQLKAGMAL